MLAAHASRTVVVVGAGLAGSVAAARAAQLGRDVVLIDAAHDATAGGNTAMSGGGVHLTAQRLDADSELLRDRVLAQGWGHARSDLADALVTTAPHARRWLVGCGVRFQSPQDGMREELIPLDTFLEPKRDMSDVHAWPGSGPQQALAALQATLRSTGGEVRECATATALSIDGAGRIDGVTLEEGGTIQARSVLLADGGFQANLALRRRFIGPRADHMFMRGASSGQGAALLMAEAVGARLANTNWFYGHVLHRDVVDNDRLWPWPTLDGFLLSGGILVDLGGRRFTDEGRGGIHLANALGWSDDPAGAWAIADAKVWNGLRDSADAVPSNPHILERGGRVVRAPDLDVLAAATGIDRDGLSNTVATYNAAASEGRAGDLPILRSRNARPLSGELIAFPAIPGITFTMGGVAIDAGAHVVDNVGEPIPGLFAAGGSAAGPTAGYIGGLATALVFGYIAGTRLAAE